MQMSNELVCSRSEIYIYYKSKFYEFVPYYLNHFSNWANRYNLQYNQLDIIIDESNWGDDVHVVPIDNRGYQIQLPKGLFERLIYLINLIIRIPVNTNMVLFDAFSDYWKNPDFSAYDYIKLPHINFSNTRLGPLLYDYNGDQELYEREFNKHWSTSWPIKQIYNQQNAIPFFWIIDFILYHEMGHILLRHLEYYDKFKKDKIITETTLDIDEIYFQRHLVELHADAQSALMLVNSLQKFQEAAMGSPLDEEMKQNMFNLAYFLQILFTYWAKTRTSIKMHDNFSHPHPDVRRIIVMNSISNYFDGIYKHEWEEQFYKAMIALPYPFMTMGAASLGDTLLNPFTYTDKLKEWQQKTWEVIQKYQRGLYEFSRYVNDFDIVCNNDEE